MKNRYISALVLILSLSTGLFAQVKINPSLGFTLENKFARYVFEPVGMGLSAMIDLETGYNHIDPVNSNHLLWKVVFGKGTQRPAIDNNYKPCNFGSLTIRANGNQVVILEWNDLRFWEEDSICSVRVTIELPEKDAVGCSTQVVPPSLVI